MTININNKEIELKSSFRAIIMYENIKEESFSPTTVNDIITYFYCLTVTSAKDYTLQFSEFIDWLDRDPQNLKDFTEWLTSTGDITKQIKKN